MLPALQPYQISPRDPAPTPPVRTLAGTLDELRALAFVPSLARHAAALRATPRGDGALVIDIPGMWAPEASLAPLRQFLKRRGYDARPWGLGLNRGRPAEDIARLAALVSELGARDDRDIHLVGQSLGGVIAREVARQLPTRIASVTTFGTPVIGGPRFTLAARHFDPAHAARMATLAERRNLETPLPMPVLAFFSKRDAVVHWPACLDRWSRDVTHYEIDAPHLGMGLHPALWHGLAHHLASAAAKRTTPTRT